MRDRMPVTIDMTPAGEFVRPAPKPALSLGKWPLRIGIAATVVALIAGAVTVAALFLWVASLLLPVALVAGAIAYGAFRFQALRNRR
jgi:hypothetical protein